MRKEIPFELFANNQTIYFDITRLAEMEKRLGCSIIDTIKKGDAGVNFCIAGISVGLRHHYHKATPEDYVKLMEKYLDDGGTLDKMAIPIIQAIVASGILGREAAERANKMGAAEEEPEVETEEDGKNE